MQRLITASCTIVLAALAAVEPAMPAPARNGGYTFRAGRTPAEVDFVEAALEVDGDLKMVEDGEVDRMKMSVAANFAYHEKSLQVPNAADGATRSVRYYSKAAGVIKSGEHEYTPGLRDQRRLIGAAVDGPKVTLFSPRGPLTAEELELIDVLANSLLLDRLLPKQAVAVGRRWEHSDELIAALLGLDTITAGDVQSVLTGVADGKARFEMSGRVTATEDGVTTEVELKGKYHFDLKSKRITWFGLLVREDRSAGHVDAGFDVVARLQMRITPGSQSPHLTRAALADVSLEPTAELTRLGYESAGGGWRFSHDRRWFVITEENKQAVLRFVDRGDKLAQCNVAALPNAADATQLTLEEFQDDVARALGENSKGLVQAGQRHNEADYRVFRVVAEGEISSVPMQWIHYLVIDEHGRRVVLAFVLEKEMLGRFEGADEKLVGTLRLVEPKIASKPDNDPQPDVGKR